jgi:uncharacterized protein (TIGR00290 family)
MTDILLSWSSGKDSAWALHVLRQHPGTSVRGLFTTVTMDSKRVASHEVRRQLVEAQARAAGLPIDFIPLPQPCSNAEYEAAMSRYLEEARGRGMTGCAFGDLLLDDVRRYREQTMAGTGIEPLFPIYGQDTRKLARTMAAAGLRAVLVSVDSRRLSPAFLGRVYDDSLLADLPDDVDPCGENGEFHSFATDGPMFEHPIAVRTGEKSERDGYVFIDLLPD